MDSKVLIESFTDFARSKNVDRPTMMRILEDMFRSIVKKKYEHDENFEFIINLDKGDLEIYRYREVVDDESEDIWDFDKIPLSEARKIVSDLEVGEELVETIKLDDFGLRNVQTARQTLIQKVKDFEKETLFANYKDRVGDLIVGEVSQFNGRDIIVTDQEGDRKSVV